MKVCVFGSGAIGGYVAASLARAGQCDVTAIARGRQLAAMKNAGLTVQVTGQTWQTPISCTDTAGELGPQDVVIVALKAPTISDAADQLKALIGPQTTLVFLMNGIPWWYYYRHGGPQDDKRIARLDPDGRIWDLIGPQR